MKIKIPINPNFQHLLNITKRYMVLTGGRGSGKSYFNAQQVLLWMLNQKTKERILLCKKVLKTVRKSQFQLLKDLIFIYNLYPYFKFNSTEMKISCPTTGSEAFALGVDDPEKTKSTEGITKVWIEETTDLNYKDFLDVDLLMRGRSNSNYQMLLSFNPINEHHWLNDFFFLTRKKMRMFLSLIIETIFTSMRKILKFLKQSVIRDCVRYILRVNGEFYKTLFMLPTLCQRNIQLWMKSFTALILDLITPMHCLKSA